MLSKASEHLPPEADPPSAEALIDASSRGLGGNSEAW
jgi:hypothetical protein